MLMPVAEAPSAVVAPRPTTAASKLIVPGMGVTPERYREALIRTAILIEEARAQLALARETVHEARNVRNWTALIRELSRRARKTNGSA
jgi:flagellar biosynthesis regulator FlaF